MAQALVAAQFGGLSPDDRQAVNDARDLDTLTYTLLGEARSEGVRGMVAVANVIRNRSTSGVYSHDPVEVVLQYRQFSTWNPPNLGGNQRSTRREAPPGSPLYNQAQEIARRYILEGGGIDLTGGSLFYHTNNTDWPFANRVRGPYGTMQIGNHTFYPQHPVPQVDIGETDLLAGYHEPAPVPLPRSMRPPSLRVVTADTITAMQREVAIANTAQSLARARAAIAAEEATPRLDAEGNVVNSALGAEGVGWSRGFGSFMLDDAAGEFVDRKAAEIAAGGSAQFQPALGLGSLLGEAFPMVPPEVEIIGGIPVQVRGPVAPGAGLTVAQLQAMRAVPPSSLRIAAAPDEIEEGALTTRVVRTVAIDPRTGMPVITEEPRGFTAPVSVLPVGQTSSRGRVGAVMRDNVIPFTSEDHPRSNAVPFTSEDHPRSNAAPFVSEDHERSNAVPFVSEDHPRSNAVKYPGDRLSPLHNVNDPSEQVSSRGAVGAAMRNAQPPIPHPASARPPSLADGVVPLSFPSLYRSEDHPRSNAPARAPGLSAPGANISVAQQQAISHVSLSSYVKPLTFPPLRVNTPLSSVPIGHGKPAPLGNPPKVVVSGGATSGLSAPTQTNNSTLRNAISQTSFSTVRPSTTTIVHQDGTSSAVPRAGSTQLPATVKPWVPPIIAPTLSSPPVGHGAPKAPAPTAATVKPQTPQFTTKTVKETIMVPNPEWGKVNPVAVNKLQDIHDKEESRIMAAQTKAPVVPKMIPKTIEKTIKVPVKMPAPVIEEAPAEEAPAPAPRPRRVAPRAVVLQPRPATFAGSATGRTYTVGGFYRSGGYVYRATPQGTFTKVGSDPSMAGMTPSQRYDALNKPSNPYKPSGSGSGFSGGGGTGGSLLYSGSGGDGYSGSSWAESVQPG